MRNSNKLTQEQKDEFFKVLQLRFTNNMNRHKDIEWADVLNKLEANPAKVVSLDAMEGTGGEPDIVDYDSNTREYIFVDCSAETPKGRRSYCYDREALDSRKANKPLNSIIDVANEMGVTVLTEKQYRHLQTLGEFDTKTSSWIETPEDVRKLGGALFCDRRYGKVFTYHNGAESYYAARAFRAMLRV